MGTKEHNEALGEYTQTIFEQSMVRTIEAHIGQRYEEDHIRVDADGESYPVTSEIIQDVILELGIESEQVYHDGGHPGSYLYATHAVLLMPDPHTGKPTAATHLGHYARTFCVPLVGAAGEYIGCFKEEIEGLLGTIEISYGRLPGCPHLTFFFQDQRTIDHNVALAGPIPTISGRVVVVHRDLDHLTIGIDPYSDTDEAQWHLDQVARDNADRISVRLK